MLLKDFKEILEYDENLGEKLSILGYLPDLQEQIDVKDENARLLSKKYLNLELKAREKTMQFGHWIQGKKISNLETLDDKNASRLFGTIPVLEYSLQRIRRNAKHTLSEAEENIIMEKDANGNSPLIQLREMIVNDFKFKFKPKGAKKEKIITLEADLMKYRTSVNPLEREAHYKALFEPHSKNIDKLFLIYQSVASDWDKTAKRRGYSKPISERNLYNDIPDKAVSTLLEVCTKNRGIFQDYFKYKAKLLGMDKLRRDDIYAPITKTKTKDIPLDEGINIILETMGKFSKSFEENAKTILQENHLDSHPRKNKRNGAFCATISPKISPYILTNYDETPRAITTLAHELGHGIHSLFANDKPHSVQHAGLTLAETASTFNEMILFDKMLKEAPSNAIKKDMLIEQMGRSYATVMRQAYFVKFEELAHKAIEKGTTSKELSNIYFDTLKEQFEDSLELHPRFKDEWATIPHIIRTPFYCYAYSFGELLSLSLYDQYKQKGKSFVPKIEKILKSGGSKNPQKVLEEVGIDINSNSFWQGGFNQIKKWQSQLETLE
jgi:oligoendopeptidase F